MIYKFTVSSEKVLQIAKEIASTLGHNYIGTEHILYGLAKEENGVASKVLKKQNITADLILEKIEDFIGSNNNKVTVLGFTPSMEADEACVHIMPTHWREFCHDTMRLWATSMPRSRWFPMTIPVRCRLPFQEIRRL